MARSPLQISARSFASRTEAKDFARSIMARYRVGEIITAFDDLFLRDLVAIHPKAHQKIGCGIAHFTTQIDSVWRKTRHFVLVRSDGTETDFSFHTCIDGSNDRRDIFRALRHAIADQVISFQRAAFTGETSPICPYTHAALTVEDAHVDHAPPDTFYTLATRWMQQCNLSVFDIRIADSIDNQCVRPMQDPIQKASWVDFHHAAARLRIISRPANLSHAKRECRIA